MIRLAIAEDHNSLIDGIRLFLEYEEDIEFVGFANNGEELCRLVAQKMPNVVITDIRMPIMDGIAATRKIIKITQNIRVIAFTMFDQDEAIKEMISAGATGYILKNSSLKELLMAIRKVHRGETFYDPNIIIPDTATKSAQTKGRLSKRQLEILQLVALGRTNQEIADQLYIGKTTVETHRKNMIRILNLKGSGELLRYALESKYDF